MSWRPYYEKTQNHPPDPTLEFAQSRVSADLPKIAIDCGCGAGRNTELLRKRDFEVFAFDLDDEAITICSKRFEKDSGAHFTIDSFQSFEYPRASLTVASYSLFFCPAEEFDESWQRIRSSLISGGVFYGTFLGPKDSWAIGGGAQNGTLPVISHTENEVRTLFDGFEIEGFDERNFDSKTVNGSEKHWHTYSVIAKRNLT